MISILAVKSNANNDLYSVTGILISPIYLYRTFQWFDIVNSCHVFDKKSSFKIALGHREDITAAQLAELRKMECLVRNMCWKGKSPHTMIPFQRGILCGIASTIDLLSEIKQEGYNHITTRKMNQVI